MGYYDVLPIISLSRMSFYVQNLAWKKSTLHVGKYENINNSDLDGFAKVEKYGAWDISGWVYGECV